MKIFIYSIVFFCLSLFSCTNDYESTQYNDWIIGKWQIENSNEYINFSHRDIFVMNDTITGSYEVQEENDKCIWFYAISNSEEYEEDGEMIFTDIDYHKSMIVKGLPLHTEETLKLYYIK